VKFSLAYLSVEQLESPMRERIEAIPTRLSLEASQVDAANCGGSRGDAGAAAAAGVPAGSGGRGAALVRDSMDS